MLAKVFGILVLLSVICAAATGSLSSLALAVTQSAGDAVTLVLSLCGMMALWSGVIRVLEKVGAVAFLSRLVRPVLRVLYPHAARKNTGLDEIAAAFSANLLGLGNASLPLGIRAMQRLSESSTKTNDRASDEMILFAVLATTPIQLIPTTLLSLRFAHGSANPGCILLPIWICSVLTTLFGIFLCRLFAGIGKKRHEPS